MDFVTRTFVTLGPIFLAGSILGDETEGKTEKERMKKNKKKQRQGTQKEEKGTLDRHGKMLPES